MSYKQKKKLLFTRTFFGFTLKKYFKAQFMKISVKKVKIYLIIVVIYTSLLLMTSISKVWNQLVQQKLMKFTITFTLLGKVLKNKHDSSEKLRGQNVNKQKKIFK